MTIKLLVAALCNGLLAMLLYILNKKTAFGGKGETTKQVIYGISFGFIAIYASTNFGGVDIGGAILNVRDSAPLCAGLIFGGPAGIIAGLIGGTYRYVATFWGIAGEYTQLACSVSTILVGFVAALLRRFMFDEKKPTWTYGVGIAMICEVFHMLMIFFTNMRDPNTAFHFVEAAAIPMILSNGFAVGIALLLVSALAKEGNAFGKGKKQISTTFQRWLLLCILIAFGTTSLFMSVLQSRMSENQTESIIMTSIDDVYQDISDASDENLLQKTENIKEEFLQGGDLNQLAEEYDVIEINIINKKGVIEETNNLEYLGYDMSSGTQSKAFLVLLDGNVNSYVQSYQPTSYDNETLRKYGAVTLEDGGFLQVGYDASQFRDDINLFVGKVTKNRHIGEEGFLVICDEEFRIVTEGMDATGKELKSLGINLDSETMEEGRVLDLNVKGQSYLCAYKFVEGYYIVGLMPAKEAMFMKDVSVYVNIFMELVIFAALFVLIYFLIKTVIIDNLRKLNWQLSQITDGNLDVVIDVRSNEEFASLSDDINSTVTTLKHYIAEAAARIDKELEFAKQIQYSSLPAAFPNRDEFEIYADMHTAKEVGGDFYDFYMLDDSTLAFLIADVSSKGIPAAMFMMRAKTTIKELAARGLEPDEIFTTANEKLCENNEASMFVTAWLGILDLKTGHLRFANAGHNPPLLCRRNGEFAYLKIRSGLTLAAMEGIQYRKNDLKLEPGDRLYLYTDGVTEATDRNENLYGEDRLCKLLNTFDGGTAEELCLRVKADVDAFAEDAEQFDDITMLSLNFHAAIDEDAVWVVPNEASRGAVDRFTESLIGKLETVPKIAGRIRIIFDELYSNILFYSNASVVGISYRIDEGNLHLSFVDDGIPYNPLEAPEPDISLSAEEREIGGLGIFMVKKMAQQMAYRYEEERNVLHIVIPLTAKPI